VAIAGAGLALFYAIPQTVVSVTYGSAFVSAAPYVFRYGAAMSVLGMTNLVVTYGIGLHRFTFVWPLLAMALCEPLAIALLHRTLDQVIDVLLVVNLSALALCLAASAMGPKSAAAVSADSETVRDCRASETFAG
jgi:hypothetical protein